MQEKNETFIKHRPVIRCYIVFGFIRFMSIIKLPDLYQLKLYDSSFCLYTCYTCPNYANWISFVFESFDADLH